MCSMLADRVETELRELILSGELAPGARLIELELCERLGASRTPVRQALHRLERDGLARGEGRSLSVAGLSAGALDDAYRVRAVLEGLAARQAAERQANGLVPPAALSGARRLAREADRATRAGALPAATEANRAFHLAIVSLAANAALTAALVPLWDQIQVTTQAELEHPARARAVDREHGAVIDAIVAGRAGAAQRAAAAHVEGTRAAVSARR